MTINSLFIHHTPDKKYSQSIQNNSTSFIEFNYIDIIKEKGQEQFNIYLKSLLKVNNINRVFILLDQCDCSLDVDYLYKLKIQFSLKIVFIFKSSQNSFEYIDRYYAQIADMNVIDDTPYIQDFYNMLDIPITTIDSFKYISYDYKKQDIDFDLSKIIKKNIFSSQLINLSVKIHNKYIDNKLCKSKDYIKLEIAKEKINEQYFNKEILKIMQNLDGNTSHNSNIIKDKKFEFAYHIYKIYWCLYRYIKTYNLIELKPLLKVKYFFYIRKIVKLYPIVKENILATALENINQALFKEYKL